MKFRLRSFFLMTFAVSVVCALVIYPRFQRKRLANVAIRNGWLIYKIDGEVVSAMLSSSSAATPETFQCLSAFPKLTDIDASDKKLTNGALRGLFQVRSVQKLDLDYTGITDEALVHLSGLRELAHLELKGMQIKGDGLRHLLGCTELRSLDLWYTRTGDADVKWIAQLPRLTTLNVANTMVTDEGLEYLHNVKSLRKLFVFDTQVSQWGVERLRQANPKLQVFWEDRDHDEIGTRTEKGSGLIDSVWQLRDTAAVARPPRVDEAGRVYHALNKPETEPETGTGPVIGKW